MSVRGSDTLFPNDFGEDLLTLGIYGYCKIRSCSLFYKQGTISILCNVGLTCRLMQFTDIQITRKSKGSLSSYSYV